jgi:hypothetical protein
MPLQCCNLNSANPAEPTRGGLQFVADSRKKEKEGVQLLQKFLQNCNGNS